MTQSIYLRGIIEAIWTLHKLGTSSRMIAISMDMLVFHLFNGKDDTAMASTLTNPQLNFQKLLW